MDRTELRDVAPHALDQLISSVEFALDEDLAAPSNLAGWSVADVIGHVTGSVHKFGALLAGEEVSRARSEPADWTSDDPVAALRAEGQRVLSLLPDAPLDELRPSPMGEVPLRIALQFPLVDTIVHAWDIQHSIGRRLELAPDLLETAKGVTDRMDARGGGPVPGFDAPVPPADGDSPTQVLMKRLGRATD